MNLFPIAYAEAENASAATSSYQGGPWSTVVMLVVFFAIFYFLLIRPQQKRAKQHRTMIAALARHDEVVTTGGIMGKIVDLHPNDITLEIAPEVKIKLQKAAVISQLPKGTLR